MQKTTQVWFDLPVRDMARAKAFYSKLFGWSFETMPIPGVEYAMIAAPGEPGFIGGMEVTPGAIPTNENEVGFTAYFSVANVDTTLELAQELGGKVAMPKVNIGEGKGYCAKFRDVSGLVVGVWSP